MKTLTNQCHSAVPIIVTELGSYNLRHRLCSLESFAFFFKLVIYNPFQSSPSSANLNCSLWFIIAFLVIFYLFQLIFCNHLQSVSILFILSHLFSFLVSFLLSQLCLSLYIKL